MRENETVSVPPFTPLTREDVARILSVSLSTLDQMIEAGVLPKPRTLGGRRVYWHPDIFYACLDQLLRSDTPAVDATDRAGTSSALAKGEAEPTTRRGPPATDLGSVRRARARDAARLADLNK